jgi:hypothetical protein
MLGTFLFAITTFNTIPGTYFRRHSFLVLLDDSLIPPSNEVLVVKREYFRNIHALRPGYAVSATCTANHTKIAILISHSGYEL